MPRRAPSPASSTRYVALLRAVNVGGHVVTMDRLRQLFEALGLARVATLIASGNVLFEAPGGDPAALERRIEAHLTKALGYDVATFLRTADEIGAAAGYEPFPTQPEPVALYVGFLRQRLPAVMARALAALQTPTDAFHVHGREFYWRIGTTFSKSSITGAKIEKALGQPTTIRNITTVRKLAAKHGA